MNKRKKIVYRSHFYKLANTKVSTNGMYICTTPSVRGTPTNIFNDLTLDGIRLSSGDKVLVRAQSLFEKRFLRSQGKYNKRKQMWLAK